MLQNWSNWWLAAAVVCSFGSLTMSVAAVLAVRAWLFAGKSGLNGLGRRLTDCESLQSELVQALSRIEARDKMRQVRAVRTEKQAAAAEPPPGSPGEPPAAGTGTIPTSELRRRLAMTRMRP